MEVFWGVFGNETPSGGNFGILAFAHHLHAQELQSNCVVQFPVPLLIQSGSCKGFNQFQSPVEIKFASTVTFRYPAVYGKINTKQQHF